MSDEIYGKLILVLRSCKTPEHIKTFNNYLDIAFESFRINYNTYNMFRERSDNILNTMIKSKIEESKKVDLSKVKSFRDQFRECRRNGTCFSVKSPIYGDEILVCDKFKTYCHSNACKKMRMNKERKEEE